MWNVLLEDSAAASGSGWEMWLIIGIALIALVVFMLLSGRKNKNSRREYMEQLDAIGPGNKVKTAGGICGIVVEVCDDNTFIIETGSEKSGKSYIKMDRELIAQTDARMLAIKEKIFSGSPHPETPAEKLKKLSVHLG